MPNGVNNTPTRPSSQCSNIFSNSSSFSQQLSATHSHGSIGHDDYVSNYSSDSNKSQFTLILQKLDESNKSISMLRDTVQTISVKLGAVEERIRKLEAMGDRDTDLTRQKKRPRKPEKNLLIASENRTSEQHSVATQLMVRLQRELILYVTDIIPRTWRPNCTTKCKNWRALMLSTKAQKTRPLFMLRHCIRLILRNLHRALQTHQWSTKQSVSFYPNMRYVPITGTVLPAPILLSVSSVCRTSMNKSIYATAYSSRKAT